MQGRSKGGCLKRLGLGPPYELCILTYHLNSGNVIYDQPENELFSSKIESVQYHAFFAITGANIKGSSQEKVTMN